MLIQNIRTGRWAILSGICCLMLGFGGCKKLIAVDQPRNTVSTDVLFQTDAQAATALSGLYSQMMTNTGALRYSNGASAIYGGLLSDELVSYGGASNVYDYEFETNTMNLANLYPNGYVWQPAYKDIYNANSIIEGATKSTGGILSDSARKELIAESKFVRAFAYFNLVNFFGDVPMPLVTDFTKTVLLSRSPAADVYKQIVQDLLDAQADLPSDYSVAKGERIRPNKYAATALLARVYLYEGLWQQAADEASLVIGSSQYALLSSLPGVFLKNSVESIWQLQPNVASSPFWLFEPTRYSPTFLWSSLDVGSQLLFSDSATFYSSAVYFVGSYYLSPGLAAGFEAGDKRRASWVVYTPLPPTWDGVRDTLWMVNKYFTVTQTSSKLTQYETKLRLAEQYLIRAEAEVGLNHLDSAMSDLNVIRSRAGLSGIVAGSSGDLLAAIWQERRVELFGEDAHRWFDLKRTGKATEVLGVLESKQPWNDYQLLMPIPVSEISADPNLTQNTGY